MSIEAQALADAQAASDEVGTGAVDSVVAGCDLIRFGVFFDGTHNFRDTAGRPDRAWHTNVDLLEEEYNAPARTVTETINGQPRKVRYMKGYFRGIGVRRDGTLDDFSGVTSLSAVPLNPLLPAPIELGRQAVERARTVGLGGGLGIGREGVRSRVNEACEDILQRLRNEAGDVNPCDLWFDVFGFSRGAAAARDFANRVRRRAIQYNGARNTTRFLGIFDTVASISSLDPAVGFQETQPPSDPYAQLMSAETGRPEFDPNIDIRAPASVASAIFHITARDEIRRNFPLSTSGGKTVAMVGAHADVGGGYQPGSTIMRYEFDSRSGWRLLEFFHERWHDRQDGNRVDRRSVANAVDHALGHNPQRITVTVEARFGLQLVSLHLMHAEAVKHGLPFPQTLPASIKGQTLPADLQAYLAALLDGGSVDATEEKRIRSKYVNWSASNSTGMDPEMNARRRVFTA
jgi:hypothetical protein